MTIAQFKINPETNDTELYIDGSFIAGWAKFDIPSNILPQISAAISFAVDHGKREQMNIVRAQFRSILGR